MTITRTEAVLILAIVAATLWFATRLPPRERQPGPQSACTGGAHGH